MNKDCFSMIINETNNTLFYKKNGFLTIGKYVCSLVHEQVSLPCKESR